MVVIFERYIPANNVQKMQPGREFIVSENMNIVVPYSVWERAICKGWVTKSYRKDSEFKITYLLTTRNRSCGKVMFSQVSVILFTGGGVVSQHALQVSEGCIPAFLTGFEAHNQGGAWGVWLGGCLQAHTQGVGVYPSMHWGRPLSWHLLLRAVRILLEYILVVLKVLLKYIWMK